MKIQYTTLLILAGLPQITEAKSYICQACAAGFYSDNNTCKPCPVGTASTSSGSQCTRCSWGLYTTTTGSTSCKECEAGYACTGGSNHTLCNAGTYSTAGSRSCKSCEAGYACSGGAVHTQCTGKTYAPAKSTSCKSCGNYVSVCNNRTGKITKCISGYYVKNNTCNKCEYVQTFHNKESYNSSINLETGIYKFELGGAKGGGNRDWCKDYAGGKGQLNIYENISITKPYTAQIIAQTGAGQTAKISLSNGNVYTAKPGTDSDWHGKRYGAFNAKWKGVCEYNGKNVAGNKGGYNESNDAYVKIYRKDLQCT